MYDNNNPEEKKLCEYIINKNDKMKLAKSNWESHWKELARYFLPNKDDIWGGMTPGQKKGQEIFDSIGRIDSERLASHFHGMITNPVVQWFQYTSGDHLIDQNPENAVWLQDTAKTINGVLNASNFQSEIHEVFLDLCSLHTSHLQVDEDPIEICKFKSSPIYECSIAENYKGVIDQVHYEYKRTLGQLFEEYGEAKLPDRLQKLRFQDPMMEVTIIQAIEPTKGLPEGLQHEMLPFTSVHILKDDMCILKVSGFEENPCIISRFYKLSGEIYGRGPAMYALPDVKTCNKMMQIWLEGAQLAINPPLQMPDEGVVLPVRLTPGGVNYYRADSKDRIEPITTGANPALGHQIIELLHAKIDKTFYLDQLHLAENDRMTTVEVSQRTDESRRVFAPVIGRFMYELIGPILNRVYGICYRRGLLQPVPTGLADRKLEIKFVSQLARAQDSIEADGVIRALQTVAGLAAIDENARDLVNSDDTVRFVYRAYGAPLHLLKTEKQLKDYRTAKADAQAAAAEAEMAKVNSEASRNNAQASSLLQR